MYTIMCVLNTVAMMLVNVSLQLPTLYFSVLMFAHVLDHCVFSARWKDHTKHVAFGTVAFLIVANFWWFKALAWGIDGPINDHWGLMWRKVRLLSFLTWPGVLMMADTDVEYL